MRNVVVALQLFTLLLCVAVLLLCHRLRGLVPPAVAAARKAAADIEALERSRRSLLGMSNELRDMVEIQDDQKRTAQSTAERIESRLRDIDSTIAELRRNLAAAKPQ